MRGDGVTKINGSRAEHFFAMCFSKGSIDDCYGARTSGRSPRLETIASVLVLLARGWAKKNRGSVAQLQLDGQLVVETAPETSQINRAALIGTQPPRPQRPQT